MKFVRLSVQRNGHFYRTADDPGTHLC